MLLLLLQCILIYVLCYLPVAFGQKCGTGRPPASLLRAHRALQQQESQSNNTLVARKALPSVHFWVHVVETVERAGEINDSLVSAQIDEITTTFSRYNIIFNVLGVTHTVDDAWGEGRDTLAMKTNLRRGDYNTLNLYIQSRTEDLNYTAGECSFPEGPAGQQVYPPDDELEPDEGEPPKEKELLLIEDGCRVAQFTLPGMDQFEGHTAVHEIGHWYGLLHTFEGDACTGPGDLVADTRIQSLATSGCPASKNSCPDVPVPGGDPFHNYMDYSSDECTHEFTPLQILRIEGIWYTLRAANILKPNVTTASSVSTIVKSTHRPSASRTFSYSNISSTYHFSTSTVKRTQAPFPPNPTPLPSNENPGPVPSSPVENPQAQGGSANGIIGNGQGSGGQQLGFSNNLGLTPQGLPQNPQQNAQPNPPNAVTKTKEITLVPVPTSSAGPKPTQTSDDWPGHTVTGYFSVGNTNIFPPELIPWRNLTHLCYAFATTNGASKNWSVSVNHTLLRYLSVQAKANGVNLILSVGGYGIGGQYFSDIAQTNSSIMAFISSVKSIVSNYSMAGVDLDWEFVGDLRDQKAGGNRPESDVDRYLILAKLLRKAMPKAQLSAAVPMYTFERNDTSLTDMRAFVPYFDRIYLMCYDLWNGAYTAGANAALTEPDAPEQPQRNETDDGDDPEGIPYVNVDLSGQSYGEAGVQAWNDSGFPLEKLVYGVPYYGYGYRLNKTNGPATTGLYSGVMGKSVGDSNETPKDKTGFWKWRNLKSQSVVVRQPDGSYGAGPDWQYGFDNSTLTPYVWGGNSSGPAQIISYDDPNSIRIKRSYAKSKGMDGVMFWAMYGDTDDGELTKVLT